MSAAAGNVGILLLLMVLLVTVFYLLQRYRSLEARYERVHVQLQSTVSQEFMRAFITKSQRREHTQGSADPTLPAGGFCVHNTAAAEAGLRTAVLLVEMASYDAPDEVSHDSTPRVVDVTEPEGWCMDSNCSPEMEPSDSAPNPTLAATLWEPDSPPEPTHMQLVEEEVPTPGPVDPGDSYQDGDMPDQTPVPEIGSTRNIQTIGETSRSGRRRGVRIQDS
jgi:hypothetical protein